MRQNGSPVLNFDTDDARSYFLVNFPIHPAFIGEPLLKKLDEANNEANEAQNHIDLSIRQLSIVAAIKADCTITRTELMKQLDVSKSTIERDLKILRTMGVLHREGSLRFGKWVLDL